MVVRLRLDLQLKLRREAQVEVHLHNQIGIGALNMANITARKVMELTSGRHPRRHPKLRPTRSGNGAPNNTDIIAARLTEHTNGLEQ